MRGLMDSHRRCSALIERAQRGDRDAFQELIARYRDRLEIAVRSRIGEHLRQRIEVEDVLQETYLKAFQALPSFEDRGRDAFFHWLRGIAENLLLYWARQYKRTSKRRLEDDVPGSHTSPSRGLRRKERFERLQEALSHLSPEHREVIILARIEGLSIKEIADRMHRTPNAVKQLLWRAVQKLRQSFGDTESFHLPPDRLTEEGTD